MFCTFGFFIFKHEFEAHWIPDMHCGMQTKLSKTKSVSNIVHYGHCTRNNLFTVQYITKPFSSPEPQPHQVSSVSPSSVRPFTI